LENGLKESSLTLGQSAFQDYLPKRLIQPPDIIEVK